MKIPKPRKRGAAWRVEFMLNGSRHSATFDTPIEAKEWAAREIIRLKDDAKRIESGEKPNHTLKELCDLYYKKVSKSKKGHEAEYFRIYNFLNNYPKLASKNIADITIKDLINWRNDRTTKVEASTVKREITLMSSIFGYAVKELLWLDNNPFSKVTRPKSAPPRNRRISQDEINEILTVCDYSIGQKPTTQRHMVAWCFLFAIDTAMRRGEILSMTWDNVYTDYIVLPDTKNGTVRHVPLLHSAVELLELVKGLDDKQVIPLLADSLKNVFRRVLETADIKDLNFHDTRHEACTRLAQLLDVKDLGKVTGHKDIGILINTYYNPTASEIAKKMNKKA
jgi:integrase